MKLKRFRAKWVPVRVKKTRRIKKIERACDSIKPERALSIDSSRLEAKGLTIRFGETPLLNDVSLTIGQHEMIGLIGPNGAGKTTLLRTLAGLRRSDGGIVSLDGLDVNEIPTGDLAKRISYLAQGGEVHWPLRVEALVGLGRLPHRHSSTAEADRTAVERAMAAADVVSLRDRTLAHVSGGERMRILLARALAVEAPLLLADEPIAALDPLHQLRVMELLHAIARRGSGVVAVLHDLSLAARFCDRLVLIAHGGITAQGSPAEVLTDTNLAKAYGVQLVHGTQDGIPFFLPRAPVSD
jgi:iron complex transport system ATP-binding protein